MTVRWKERKVEDDLLKRELLLRLRAEHHATPGRSRAATDHFRRRVRRLMLLHPLFAFKYYLLAIDLGLGRVEGRERDSLAESVSAATGGRVIRTSRAPRRSVPRWRGGSGRALARGARLVRRGYDEGISALAAAGVWLWHGMQAAVRVVVAALGRLGRLAYDGLVGSMHAGASLLVRLAGGARRRWPVVRMHLIRLLRECGAFSAGVAVAVGRFLVSAGSAGRAAFARVVSELRRQRLILRAAVRRAERALRSAFERVGGELQRQEVILRARRTRLRRAGKSLLARAVGEWRRERLVVQARLLRLRGIAVATLARLVAESRRRRVVLSAWLRLHRRTAVARCASARRRLTSAARTQRLVLRARLIRVRSALASALGVAAASIPRLWSSVFARLLEGLERGSSMLARFGATTMELGRTVHERWVQLRSDCESMLVRVMESGRQRRSALRERLAAIPRICGSALAGLAAEARWLSSRTAARVVGVRRTCEAALARFVVGLRRRRLVLLARIGRLAAAARAVTADVAVPRPRRPELRRARRVRVRGGDGRRWATGVVIAGVVVAAAGAVVVTRSHDPGRRIGTATAPGPTSTDLSVHHSWHPPRAVPNPTLAAQAGSRSHGRVDRTNARPERRRPQPTHEQKTVLVSNTVQNASPPAAAATKTPVGATSQRSGPAPLASPPGGSGPTPLKAP